HRNVSFGHEDFRCMQQNSPLSGSLADMPPARREYRPELMGYYSGLMLADRITLAHLSVSAAISLPKSAGEPRIPMAPSSASRALILGSARAALFSLLSLSIITTGVFLGAPTPSQLIDS